MVETRDDFDTRLVASSRYRSGKQVLGRETVANGLTEAVLQKPIINQTRPDTRQDSRKRFGRGSIKEAVH